MDKTLSRIKRTLESPLPVFDLRDGKVKLICRDGYYPKEVLDKLVGLEYNNSEREN